MSHNCLFVLHVATKLARNHVGVEFLLYLGRHRRCCLLQLVFVLPRDPGGHSSPDDVGAGGGAALAGGGGAGA